MKSIEEKKKDLNQLRDDLAYWMNEKRNLEYGVDNFELDPDDFEDDFCLMLDQTHEEIEIGSGTYSYSHLYKEIDETGFNCNLNDYANEIDKDESDEYRELTDQLEEAENKIDDLETQYEELVTEIENDKFQP